MDIPALERSIIEDGKPAVSLLVGPNGAGKSQALRSLAVGIRGYRDVLAIINTVHDRLSRLRDIKKIASTHGSGLPARLIKRTISVLFERGEFRPSEVQSILEYCGYEGAIGLRIRPGFRWARELKDFDFEDLGFDEEVIAELYHAATLASRLSISEISWIELGEFRDSFQASFLAQYLSVIYNEVGLKKLHVIKELEVFLRMESETVPLKNASSVTCPPRLPHS